jgi:hypothetical protein
MTHVRLGEEVMFDEIPVALDEYDVTDSDSIFIFFESCSYYLNKEINLYHQKML